MKLLLLFLVVLVAADFEPSTRDFRLSLLVKNVLLDENNRPFNLEYADVTSLLQKNIDKLGYILETDKQKSAFPSPELSIEAFPLYVQNLGLGTLYRTYQTAKQKIKAQINKIQTTLQNPEAHSVYLIETTGDIYLLVISSKLEFETLDLIDWYNNFIGDNWGKRRWCEQFDPWNEVRVVVVGEDPWVECAPTSD